MTPHPRPLLLVAALALLGAVARGPAPADAAEASHAAPSVEGLAGGEGDDFGQGYGYGSLGLLIPVGSRWTLPARVNGSYLYYNFLDSGIKTSVRSAGVNALVGARLSGSRGTVTLMGGAEVRREHHVTEGVPGALRPTIWGAMLQVDGDLAVSKRWRALGLANYTGAAKYLYSRGALQYQLTNLDWRGRRSFFAGVEAIRQGNDESDAWQTGALAECTFVPARLSLSVRGGYKDSWSPGSAHRRGRYLGLGLYRRF